MGGFLFRRGLKPERLVADVFEWRADPKNDTSEPLSDAEAAILKERLPLLLEPFDGRIRQLKAERLAKALGHVYETFDLICELRPVYDTGHTEVVGLIPLTILKIVATGGDGLPVTTEVVLSGSQVKDIAAKANDAVKKIGVLRDLAAAIHKPIPSVPVTEMGE